MDALDSLVSISEASELLPVSTSLLYNLIKDHRIPSIKIGKRVFLKRTTVERVMRDGTDPIPQQHPVLNTENK